MVGKRTDYATGHFSQDTLPTNGKTVHCLQLEANYLRISMLFERQPKINLCHKFIAPLWKTENRVG